MDLFDMMNSSNKMIPLAERMRAQNLDEFVGQEHIVGSGSLLRRAIIADKLGNCIFYGAPGSGKSTLAKIIANMTGGYYETMNAVLSGVADAKKIIDEARSRFNLHGKRTYLILDECHRWNKAQSDCLLAPIEQGFIVLIGTTTENPYISMTKAVLSRSRIFKFLPLRTEDVLLALQRAVVDSRGYGEQRLIVDEDALAHIAAFSSGDLRSAYNALELAFITTPVSADGYIHIDKQTAMQSIETKNFALDESTFYDMLSAFCKSLRGSDADAAVYWSHRMLVGGIDPLVVGRRLIAHSAEDVGMADPHALLLAQAAMYSIEKMGMPECEIPLTEAIIYVAEASKSNSVVAAIAAADELVKAYPNESVPKHLVNQPYRDREDYGGYLYPHSYGGWVKQTYLPNSLTDKKVYSPNANGYEGKLIRAKVIAKNKG